MLLRAGYSGRMKLKVLFAGDTGTTLYEAEAGLVDAERMSA